ncbi:hypothetical protein JOD43_003504 [Pullulanibacillus pueri]|uniref:Spore coat protein n=1 Tax=Pullulanibacillus pueri TaxID=1437324 RepID=A0A8J2ZY94_9BACL|nr:spore coat protein [Pullulanibacillus pueri]MBM7683324.1 hypothetical protein [Pullulanibacillus pueri]GGH86391.1 spore coat protein [Pullulanibacillus pueri]
MNPIVQNMTGMGGMTDQIIASDLLVSAKSAIHSYAVALCETTSPKVRATLQQQLNDAIGMHEQVTNYMVQNGYYHPADVGEQIALDNQNAQKALKMSD